MWMVQTRGYSEEPFKVCVKILLCGVLPAVDAENEKGQVGKDNVNEAAAKCLVTLKGPFQIITMAVHCSSRFYFYA